MNSGYYSGSYETSYGLSDSAGLTGAMAGMGIFFWILIIGISVLMIVSIWKIFTKAGKPGWAAIVPIYNIYIMCEIAEKPWWYILLLFVPFANIYAIIVIYDGIAKKFGKSSGFTVGMFFLSYIFFPILAFSSNSVYMGEVSNTNIINSSDTVTENNTSDVGTINNNVSANIDDDIVQNNNESDVYEAPTFDNEVNNNVMQNEPVANEAPIQQPINDAVNEMPINNEVNNNVTADEPVVNEAPIQQPINDAVNEMPINNEVNNNVTADEPVVNEAPIQQPINDAVNETPIQNLEGANNTQNNDVNTTNPGNEEVQLGNETHTSFWSQNNNNNNQ